MHTLFLSFAMVILFLLAIFGANKLADNERELSVYCYDMGYSKAINVSRDLAYCYKLENGTEVIIKVIK